MTFLRASLWFVPVVALSALAVAAVVRKPLVEPGLLAPKSGVVMDAQTRQPLAGAYVVVRWLEQARAGAHVEGQCLHRTVVRTDEQGRYAVAALQLSVADHTLAERRYFWDAYAYASGYADSSSATVRHPRVVASAAPGIQSLETIALAADSAAPAQRIATLADMLSHVECLPYAKAEANPVAEQIYREAYAAACLPESPGAIAALARLPGVRTPDAQACAQERHASN
jgi:hypothetical protein